MALNLSLGEDASDGPNGVTLWADQKVLYTTIGENHQTLHGKVTHGVLGAERNIDQPRRVCFVQGNPHSQQKKGAELLFFPGWESTQGLESPNRGPGLNAMWVSFAFQILFLGTFFFERPLGGAPVPSKIPGDLGKWKSSGRLFAAL